jgi:peptidoglycan/xylan/chitin deacetylase (PgdA/CDA1 family)
VAGKRERVAAALEAVRVSNTLLAVRSRTPPVWLTILTYHRVGSPKPGGTPFPDETYDASSATFAEQLRFLSEHFRFVTTEDVLAFLQGGTLPPNPVLLTFDDGYRECLTEAVPLMQDYGATGTFFIATDYVEERRLFWWDKIYLLVSRATEDPIVLDYPEPMTLSRDDAYEKLNRLVKTHRGLDLARFLDHLQERSGASLSRDEERELVDAMIMTWDEINELVDAGMDVQSHTRSHRVMQTLLPEQLDDELGGSRKLLEERIGRPVRTLAYPVGYPIDGHDDIRRALEDAGYEAAYTNMTGAQPCFGKVDRYQVRRIAMSEEYRGTMFRSVMAFPPLAY